MQSQVEWPPLHTTELPSLAEVFLNMRETQALEILKNIKNIKGEPLHEINTLELQVEGIREGSTECHVNLTSVTAAYAACTLPCRGDSCLIKDMIMGVA